MFENLKAEIARKGLTKKVLSAELEISESTLYRKMTGKVPFSFNECKAIKEILGVTHAIEYLFLSHEV